MKANKYTDKEANQLKEELLNMPEGTPRPKLTSADPHERKLAEALRDFTTQ